MPRKRVMVAMSGGVDSSVAAALLAERGYQVVGVTMRLWHGDQGPFSGTCCSLEAVEDARRVCQTLGIPFYPLNLTREFQSYVIDYFCQEYHLGRTPNPCLACNHLVKFHFLLGKALALGMDFLATGHYARIYTYNGGYRLLRGADPAKDQSYVLYTLGQEELGRLVFPVGGYPKEEVRRMAAQWGLAVAQKPDSQEVCFIAEGDYRQFLKGRVPLQPGPVVDREGRLLGQHQGLPFYTIGQRRGLGLAMGTPYYVVGIDAPGNTLVVGTREELEAISFLVREVHLVSGARLEGPLQAEVQVRYRSPPRPATVSLQEYGARVDFHMPQRAITPGQAAVFYKGDEVLGGGIIQRVLP